MENPWFFFLTCTLLVGNFFFFFCRLHNCTVGGDKWLSLWVSQWIIPSTHSFRNIELFTAMLQQFAFVGNFYIGGTKTDKVSGKILSIIGYSILTSCLLDCFIKSVVAEVPSGISKKQKHWCSSFLTCIMVRHKIQCFLKTIYTMWHLFKLSIIMCCLVTSIRLYEKVICRRRHIFWTFNVRSWIRGQFTLTKLSLRVQFIFSLLGKS